MEHPIRISPAQMRKLVSGGAVTLQPQHFAPEGGSPHSLMVMPNTARRIATALRKSKGLRIALKPEEDLMSNGVSMKQIEGGRTYAQRLASRTRKTFEPVAKVANVVKRGFNKEIVDSGVGKEIAKGLIRAGTEVVLPAALGGLSMMAGDPTGMSGQIVGNMAGKYINRAAEKGGYGMKCGGSTYKQRLARRTKNTFKAIARNPIVKEIGKTVLREGAKAAGQAISSYTGNPAAGVAFERLAVSGGDKFIDTGSAGKAIGASKNVAKRMAVEVVDDYIDNNLSGREREMAQKALAGKYSSAKDLVYDYGNSKLEDMMTETSGYGIPRRSRGGLRMGKGLAYLTPAYSQSMRSVTMGAGFKVADGRRVTTAPQLGEVIQLGAPYARFDSPAMSPFIPSSPQLAGFKIGGSFLPAGRSGGSFLSAG